MMDRERRSAGKSVCYSANKNKERIIKSQFEEEPRLVVEPSNSDGNVKVQECKRVCK